MPSVHGMSPQQSSFVAHEPMPPEQHTSGRGMTIEFGAAPHVSPEQQPPDMLHDAPASMHIVSGWHMNVWQVRPIPHSELLVQNEPMRPG